MLMKILKTTAAVLLIFGVICIGFFIMQYLRYQ